MAAKSSSDQTFGQCRCCLDFGYHKEIGRPYYSNGVRQVYRETFLETFNLSLSKNKKLMNMICESCINRLNDATEFKAMVVESERQLLSRTENVSSNTELICVGQDTGVQKDHINTIIKKEEVNDWNNDGDEMDTQDVEEQATGVYSWRNIENITKSYDEFPKKEEMNENEEKGKQVNTNLKGRKRRGGEKIEIEIIGQANVNPITDDIKKATSEQTNEEGKHVAAGIDLPGPFKAENKNVSRKNKKQGVKCPAKKINKTTGIKSVDTLEIVKKPFACDMCDRKFTLRANLLNHARTHTGEKPFSCEICGKTFIQISILQRHIRTHTGEKPYACKICGKKFGQKSTLISHVRTHTGEKPYACKFCDARFAQKNNLKSHVKTHTGEKPYACKICDKRFISSSDVRKHIIRHTGEKPYSCSICFKELSSSSDLRKHIITHTGEKPYSKVQ